MYHIVYPKLLEIKFTSVCKIWNIRFYKTITFLLKIKGRNVDRNYSVDTHIIKLRSDLREYI